MGFFLRCFWVGTLLLPVPVSPQAVNVTSPSAASETGEQDLTDEKRHQSQTFVNEALGNKIVREECAKLDDPKACRGQGEGAKFLGMDSNMIAHVAKAYSLLMGSMYKGGLDAKVPEEEGETPEGSAAGEDSEVDEAVSDNEGEKKDDYCVMIGAGGETVATAMEQLAGKTVGTPTGGATEQKEALYKAARVHRDKAKGATIKAAAWGGATACYVSMMSFGGAAWDSTKNILKTAAAGVLTVFYFKESRVQKKYAVEVRRIADKLPGAGDCNPITQKDCYCSLEEYRNDPKHCVPYLHKNKLSRGSVLRVACTNDRLQADPNCQCAAKDTCLDKRLRNAFVGSAMGPGFLNTSIGSDVGSLARGELKSGALTSSNMEKNVGLKAFFGKRNRGELPPAATLNPSREGEASRLSRNFGLPPELSRRLVAAPVPSDLSAMTAKLGGAGVGVVVGSPAGKKAKSAGRVWDFQGGEGLGGRSNTSSPSRPGFDLKKYLQSGKKKKPRRTGKVLTFNRRAINSAEVGKNSHKNIFHIISRRYILWTATHTLNGSPPR